MATDLTAEKLAQRALDVNIVSETDLRSVWSELGTRNVEADQLAQILLRQGLVTNYQLDRLNQGFRHGVSPWIEVGLITPRAETVPNRASDQAEVRK